jgi:hypothetical protein
MLTLIISTQRTGSTSLLRSLEGNIWIPKESMHRYELFNFSNLPIVNNKQLELYYLSLLLEYLEQNPDENVLVKVLVDQVSITTLKCLVKHASFIHHAIRLDYGSQLSSLVCANKTSSWYERSKIYTVEITQDDINECHEYLSNIITLHSTIYKKYPGKLHILEDRDYSPYLSQHIINAKELTWPNFNTKELFL